MNSTTGEAARAVGVSTATLARWAADGTVTPAERTAGGHYRWDLASLRAQVDRHRSGGHNTTAEDIARCVHAAQRELQIVQGDPWPSAPWDEADAYQVRQVVAGVAEALADPGITPERSHQLWCDRMRADGWRYGPVKDAGRKTHPCLLPWDGLPAGAQMKDRLFLAIVAALAPREDGGPA